MLLPYWPSVAFFIVFVLAVSGHGQAGPTSDALPRNTDGTLRNLDTPPRNPDFNFLQAPWISDLFYQALANFTPRDVGTTACRKQTEMYDRNLRNHTSWAVRMADSWNRQPVGILAGNNYQMGVYDECIDVQYPVKGQYCLSEIKLIPPAERDYRFNRTEDLDSFGNNHAWHTILGWTDYPDQISRNRLTIGICIPDSCSAIDLQISLQKELDKVFDPELVKTIVKVDPIMCTVSGDTYQRTTAYYVTCTVFSLLVFICFCVTTHNFVTLTYQRLQKETGEISDSILNSFSIIKSVKELLKYDKNNELNIMNGFKVLTMIVILFGHRFMYIAGNPMSYPKNLENIYLYGPDVLLTCMNMVDPFFYTSGYLMYITLYSTFEKAGSVWMKLLSPIIYRIARLLPAYCAMMAISAHIMPHLGDGPLWQKRTWDEAEKCQNYWWTNLLFISNFVDVKYQCLMVSWYVACDVQFFAIGVIIVYVYMKNNKYGIALLGTMLSLSLVVPFFVTLMMKYDGILKVYLPFLENPRSSDTFNMSYRPSYMRATPFLTGIAFAFIVKKLKENKINFSQVTVYCGTFIMTVICVWVQLYGAIFYTRDRPYYPLEQALYAVLGHCTWSVLGGWVSICHFTTGYGLLEKLFNNRFTVPLGRLSYSVFLVNLVVMMMSQSEQRLPTYPSAKSLLDAWIYDTFKCYLMGFFLYLIVEAPMGDLIRRMFGRRPMKKLSNMNDVRVEKTMNIEPSKKESSHL